MIISLRVFGGIFFPDVFDIIVPISDFIDEILDGVTVTPFRRAETAKDDVLGLRKIEEPLDFIGYIVGSGRQERLVKVLLEFVANSVPLFLRLVPHDEWIAQRRSSADVDCSWFSVTSDSDHGLILFLLDRQWLISLFQVQSFG